MSKQNVFRRIFDAVRGKTSVDNEKKKPYVATGYETQIYGYDYATSNKQAVYLNEMKGWVGGCVNAIADEVAVSNIKLYKYEKEEVEEVHEHKVLDLLYKVNDFTTKFDHFWLTQAYLELTGEAPWFIERQGGDVVGIYLLNPVNITPFASEEKMIAGYKYRIGGIKEVVLQPEEVIFLKYPNPARPFRGLGTLEQAALSVDIDRYSEQWNRNFYENSARPDGILSVDVKQLSDEQKDILKRSIKEQYQGLSKAHNVMVLFGDMKYEKSTFSQKDMDFLEQQRFSRDKILGIFRVPKAIVSQTEDVNYASARTAQYVFARFTIKPKLERLIQQLNEFLLPLFPDTENLFLDFDNPVPADEEIGANMRNAAVATGTMTINEAREQMGLPDVDGGDAIYLPFNLMPIGEERPVVEEPTEEKPEEEPKEEEGNKRYIKLSVKKFSKKEQDKRRFGKRIDEMKLRSKTYFEVKKKSDEIYQKVKNEILKHYKDNMKKKEDDRTPRRKFSPEQINEYWQIKNAIFKSYLSDVRNAMVGVFRKQRKETLPKLERFTKAFKVDSNELFNAIKLNPKKEITRTLQMTIPIFTKLFKRAGDKTFEMLDVDMEIDVLRDEIINLIDAKGRKFATGVTKVTNDKIKEQVVDGLANNENMIEIKNRIRNVFVEAEESRAMAIARTETLRYNASASEEAFIESEIVEGKMWVTNPSPCEECAELAGKTMGLGESFVDKGGSVNGVEFDYEDVITPPLHANCECDIVPIFKPTK